MSINQSENRMCQNCKQDFTIDQDDFSFYEKMKVPAPTFCPECRAKRRLVFRNARSLYKRDCALCKKTMITIYPDYKQDVVYCNSCWYGDNWDAFIYGVEFNESEEFLKQFQSLLNRVPKFSVFHKQPLINCDYTNLTVNSKDCYLAYSVTDSENIRYSENVDKSKSCLDSYYITECTESYENINCYKNYNSKFCLESKSCIDSLFLYDCQNCTSCFMSSNQRNKTYMFYNKQLTKDEYKQKMDLLKQDSYIENIKLQNDFKIICQESYHKYADVLNSKNVSGNYLVDCTNVKNCFNINKGQNLKNSMRVIHSSTDSRDVYGLSSGNLVYECITVTYSVNNCAFSMFCHTNVSNIFYSAFCTNSSDLFGCVGLKNAKYCILNKQYSKEDYFKKVEKIKAHMNILPYIDKNNITYKYGEFFPIEFSPFGYNETLAFDIFNMPKKQIHIENYTWKEFSEKDYQITLMSEKIPDRTRDVDSSISSEVIECAHKQECNHQCTKAFRISENDLAFYKNHNIPLPRYCPNCRHYERLTYRNPLKLWHRSCMKEGCNNEFETSYAPDRPEIVYCEKCYREEVY